MFASSTQREKAKEFLQFQGTLATVLLAIVLDTYGTEALEWDFMTVEQELQEDFGASLPDINRDKLQAIITAVTTDQFQTDWYVFNAICEALNDDPVDFTVMDPVDPDQMAWGITEVLLNEDPKNPIQLSPEVRRYMGVLLERSGARPTDVLQLAIPPEDRLNPNELDDPTLYSGYFARVKSDEDYVVSYIRDRLGQLVAQLDAAPLVNRDPKAWDAFKSKVERKLAGLQQSDRGT